MSDTQSAIDLRAARIADLLRRRTETIAIAESSAGGLISAALLRVPGASRYFLGGSVVYTGTARTALLGIEAGAMTGMRSSSEPYARLLAHTVRERLGADWGLAETGAAGPSGNRYGDAPGHTCVAVDGPRGVTSATLETESTDRAANMEAFALRALDALETALMDA